MAHAHGAGFVPGNRWVECDRCGFDYRKNQIKLEWNGLAVCLKCWETRHPQDFVKAVTDHIAPYGPVRTEKISYLDQSAVTAQTDEQALAIISILEGGESTPTSLTTSAVAGVAIAGAAISGTT